VVVPATVHGRGRGGVAVSTNSAQLFTFENHAVPGARRSAGGRERVTPRALRKLCLSFPGTYEDFPFGEVSSVFKVEKKLFAISALEASPLAVSAKLGSSSLAARCPLPGVTLNGLCLE
jgi:hypothetical protein